MVNPVNISGSQQAAIANPFQSQNARQTDETRRAEQGRTQATTAQEAGTDSRSRRSGDEETRTAAAESENRRGGGSRGDRGSVVDISV